LYKREAKSLKIVQGFPGDKDQIIANCNMKIMCERVPVAAGHGTKWKSSFIEKRNFLLFKKFIPYRYFRMFLCVVMPQGMALTE